MIIRDIGQELPQCLFILFEFPIINIQNLLNFIKIYKKYDILKNRSGW